MSCASALNFDYSLWVKFTPFSIVLLVIVISVILVFKKITVCIDEFNMSPIETDSVVKFHEMVYYELDLIKEEHQLKLQILSKWPTALQCVCRHTAYSSCVTQKPMPLSDVSEEIHPSASLLFCNINNFHQLSDLMSAHEKVTFLQAIDQLFDSIIRKFSESNKVFKVETVENVYFVASGLERRETGNSKNPVTDIALLALALMKSINHLEFLEQDFTLSLSIGLHTGPVASGVIGLDKRQYCLFGDAVNLASRLCSQPSQIQISSEFAQALKSNEGFLVEERGEVQIKGKGTCRTYWLIGTVLRC